MAVVVIGDIDISEVQKEVLQRFQYEYTFIEHPKYPLPLVESDEVEFASFPIDDKSEIPSFNLADSSIVVSMICWGSFCFVLLKKTCS